MRKVLLSCLIVAGFASCSTDSEDPQPAATAAFTASRSVVEVNERVAFTDASQNAARYEWNFGNGQTATVADPSVTFAAPGTYTVVLTAYNADNQATSSTQTIKVGKRYLREIKITALNFLAPDGTLWDSGGSGPDVLAQLKPASPAAAPFYQTTTVSNVKQTDLPLTFPVNNELTPGEWTLVVRDEDSSSSDEMNVWTFTVAEPTANRDAQGNGFYTLQGPQDKPSSWNVIVSYETR